MRANGQVNTLGPHQRLNSSGSVHAFHTSACGASNVRVITIGLLLTWVSMVQSFLLYILCPCFAGLLCQLLAQQVVQHVEAALPEARHAPCPALHLLDCLRIDAVDALLRPL